MSLTSKQKLFCEEYIVDLNGKQAAIRAGYSEKTAENQASRMLTKVKVSSYIQELMDKRSKKTEITAERVIREIAHIAFDDISNYLEFKTVDTTDTDSEGEPIPRVITKIKDSREIDTRSISEVSQTKDGFRFKMYCKDNALALLGKHLKLFTEKDPSDDNPQPLSISFTTKESDNPVMVTIGKTKTSQE